uniref:Conotoxin Cl11.1 n=1 Tax=Californiconus californicus TaxID=1736779 RepID=I1B1_CONCL
MKLALTFLLILMILPLTTGGKKSDNQALKRLGARKFNENLSELNSACDDAWETCAWSRTCCSRNCCRGICVSRYYECP